MAIVTAITSIKIIDLIKTGANVIGHHEQKVEGNTKKPIRIVRRK
jgi:hypothetical protein